MLRSPRADSQAARTVVSLDADLLRSWPLPIDDEGDKYSRGTVLIIGGSVMTPGAVLLAGRAALRMGAGRLQIATVGEVALAVAVALPEAKVLPFDGNADDEFRESIRTADAVTVGPGLVGDDVGSIVEAVLRDARSESIIVLDAAAIGAFERLDSALLDRTRSRLVMTPNRQEVHSLIRDAPTDDAAALGEAARSTGAVLTSFGRVHAPDGRRWESRVNPLGLGTSGSGDVLAGMVGGAAARCGDRAQAACWATYAHHRAGHILQSRIGVLGYMATDLLEQVPACLPS
jgi:ADP-dependent NAD(P)H-hydrate dehydratase